MINIIYFILIYAVNLFSMTHNDLFNKMGIEYTNNNINNELFSENKARDLDMSFIEGFELNEIIEDKLKEVKQYQNWKNELFKLKLDDSVRNLFINFPVFAVFQSDNNCFIENTKISFNNSINTNVLLANKPIKKEGIISEYTGEIKYEFFTENLSFFDQEKNVSDYCMSGPNCNVYAAELMYHSIYIHQLKEKKLLPKFIIDASKKGNEARFANHSFRFANSKLVLAIKVNLSDDNIKSIEPSLYLAANNDINKGAQILWDYNYDFEDPSVQEICINHSWLDLHPSEEECFTCTAKRNIGYDCKNCTYAKYCSENCQQIDKPLHKKHCYKRND